MGLIVKKAYFMIDQVVYFKEERRIDFTIRSYDSKENRGKDYFVNCKNAYSYTIRTIDEKTIKEFDKYFAIKVISKSGNTLNKMVYKYLIDKDPLFADAKEDE